MAHMFEMSNFNQPLEKWDVSNVVDMSYMFSSFFNQRLNSWQVSKTSSALIRMLPANFNPLFLWSVSEHQLQEIFELNAFQNSNELLKRIETHNNETNHFFEMLNKEVYKRVKTGIDVLNGEIVELQKWIESDEDNLIFITPNIEIDTRTRPQAVITVTTQQTEEASQIVAVCVSRRSFDMESVIPSCNIVVPCGLSTPEHGIFERGYSREMLDLRKYLFLKERFSVDLNYMKSLILNKENRIFVVYVPRAMPPHECYTKTESLKVFDIAKCLRHYSYQWDSPMNCFLRNPETYFNSEIFKSHVYRYIGKNNDRYDDHLDETDAVQITKPVTSEDQQEQYEQAMTNVKNHIDFIDKCFLHYAPRTTSDNTFSKTLWRGTSEAYKCSVGESIELKGFLSTSWMRNIGEIFTNKDDLCCLHKLTLDVGIPYINMSSVSVFGNDEREILLPRNLKATLTDITEEQTTIHGQSVKKRLIYHLLIQKSTPDQFQEIYEKTKCEKFFEADVDICSVSEFFENNISSSTEKNSLSSKEKISLSSEEKKSFSGTDDEIKEQFNLLMNPIILPPQPPPATSKKNKKRKSFNKKKRFSGTDNEIEEQFNLVMNPIILPPPQTPPTTTSTKNKKKRIQPPIEKQTKKTKKGGGRPKITKLSQRSCRLFKTTVRRK